MGVVQNDININYANEVISLVQQIRNMKAAIAELLAINSQVPLGNLWATLKTTAINSDGTLGTADSGSPIAANPIDSRVYTNLSRAVKLSALNDGLGVLVDFNAFCAGTSLTTQAARPAQIDNLSM